jgi:DNA-directed RNA polymerase specialized sigma24 family protein
MTARERLLEELRPVAFAIAYRMLGSVSEATDVVQEALLRVHQALQAGEEIASPRASLLQSKVHDTLRLVEGKEI